MAAAGIRSRMVAATITTAGSTSSMTWAISSADSRALIGTRIAPRRAAAPKSSANSMELGASTAMRSPVPRPSPSRPAASCATRPAYWAWLTVPPSWMNAARPPCSKALRRTRSSRVNALRLMDGTLRYRGESGLRRWGHLFPQEVDDRLRELVVGVAGHHMARIGQVDEARGRHQRLQRARPFQAHHVAASAAHQQGGPAPALQRALERLRVAPPGMVA